MQMSSFRNVSAFDKELNYGSPGMRRYSLSVNNPTLDKLLTKLSEEVLVPDDDEEVLRAVSVVGKNIGIAREPVWCLNREVAVDKHGSLTKPEEHGLIWISHLADKGNGREIADESLSARIEGGEVTTVYFDAMAHFLAGTLEDCRHNDAVLRAVVSELFDGSLAFDTEEACLVGEPVSPQLSPLPGEEKDENYIDYSSISETSQRDHFLSQFFIASSAVIMANYQEVTSYICIYIYINQSQLKTNQYLYMYLQSWIILPKRFNETQSFMLLANSLSLSFLSVCLSLCLSVSGGGGGGRYSDENSF